MWSVCLHATIKLQWDQLTKGIALTGQIYRSLFRLNQTGKLWHHTKAVDFRLQVVVQNLGDQDKVVLISQPWFEAMDLHELMRFSVHISQSGWLLLLDRSKSLQTLIMYDWPFPEYFFLSNWALTVTICHSYKKKNLQSGWWDVPHISDYSGFLLGRVDAFDWTQTVCFPTNESSFSKFLKWPEVSKTTHRWGKQCIYSPCAFFFFPFPQQQSQKNRCQTREIGILNSHRQVYSYILQRCWQTVCG